MWRRFVLASLLVLVPSLARAQDAPERLLPSGCQIYVHWDGFEKHRDAFDKTALGKMMKGDTGKLLSYLVTYARENIEAALRNEREAKMALEIFDEAIATLKTIGNHGFIIGLEVKQIVPQPQVEAVVVFPNNGKTLTRLMTKILKEAPEQPKETQVGTRKVFSFSAPGNEVHFGWFVQGEHAVIALSTEHPATIAKRADGGDAGITKNALFKQVAGFKEFKTWARGYLDLGSAWELIGGLAPQANQVIGNLGLNGLQNVTFLSGFEGAAERGIVEINTTEKRTGLLALLNQKTIKLADLPPLPDDATGFSASNFNPANLFEGLVQIADAIGKVVPEGFDAREIVKQLEGVTGVKLAEDLFGSFEGLAVSYSTSSEGPLGLGGVAMLKVKDKSEKKLQESIEKLIKSIPPLPFVEIKLRTKEYRGVPFHELVIKTQGEFPLFTYTIHNGWFALSSFPQPLYGFILRSKGDLPVWKASDDLTKRLEAFPKEFTSISVSDPRPVVEFILSVLPTVGTVVNQILPFADANLKPFDTSMIPHAREATRELFPNITVTTDNGRKIRIESRSSLSIPLLAP